MRTKQMQSPSGESFEVSTDGMKVWVNKAGACAARFCQVSGEVFDLSPNPGLPENVFSTFRYLFHARPPLGTGKAEWGQWVRAVTNHYGITVPGGFAPEYAR